jgi:hypothetical protein
MTSLISTNPIFLEESAENFEGARSDMDVRSAPMMIGALKTSAMVIFCPFVTVAP